MLALVACTPSSGSKVSTDTPGPESVVEDGDAPVIDGDHNLIRRGHFDDNRHRPWRATFGPTGAGRLGIEDGALCVHVDAAGDAPWDAQLRHRGLQIVRGHHYVVRFTAHADHPVKIRAKVAMTGPPYTEYWGSEVEVIEAEQGYEGHFVMRAVDDGAAELTFQFGGKEAGAAEGRLCLDDVAIMDPQFDPPANVDRPVPLVATNQVGFRPRDPKRATVAHRSTDPLPWRLLDQDGSAVAEGRTRVVGPDRASGEHVHTIDFTDAAAKGEGFTLDVEGQQTHPFAIEPDVYRGLKYDALAFFYHNRSGIEIEMPYAGDSKWTRPSGHPKDREVTCMPSAPCDYTLDASGGWYDAGDHGKYVVNAGISVWTLLNLWERVAAKKGRAAAFADGSLSIPERGNGVPDLLDEVRWEVELLLRLQVPAGQPLAGMVHHKVHDEKWTDLPTAPHQDPQPRYAHPPTTSATLNLAAVAAQAARVWKTIDRAFSRRCLDAARRAWAAARVHPDRKAPDDDNVGGGPYGDGDLTDEVYWAAAELFATTAEREYRKALEASPRAFEVMAPSPDGSGPPSSMDWQRVGTLGTVTLATVPTRIGQPGREAAKRAIVAAADRYVGIAQAEGYGLPMVASTSGRYAWGSNSMLLNNMVVLGIAHDLTGKDAYREAVVAGMDYLLGRNPLGYSYVTGWGDDPIAHPHHRFWAHALDPAFPPPPPGVVSGGPNSGLEDPLVKAAGFVGCAPQRCYYDHIESWSTNEVAINWNAPLVWVATFLDGRPAPRP